MIEISDLEFHYGDTGFRLRIPKLSIKQGERVAIVGLSGSGKTTLLLLVAGVFLPARGSIHVGDIAVNELTDAARRSFRASNVGFVFQDFELIEYLNVRENILLPYLINGSLKHDAAGQTAASQLADVMDISDKLARRPKELSHGERQRVSICRALITAPQVLLADEPTGSLDPDTTDRILDTLVTRSEEIDSTLLFVTHDHRLLDRFDRTIDMLEFCVASPTSEGS
ncbi:MAG: ABC transporter ATP-binding protein [Planctomycetaceae bacterium]|nr:ABC transporter ATP-binding protein [Planctomycetaceae bacterium]